MKEKNTLVKRSRVLSDVDFETSNSKSEVLKSNSWKITSFSKTTLHHNVLYYQQLSMGCYQVNFYANNYFE